MDLIGDIVEHDIAPPTAPTAPSGSQNLRSSTSSATASSSLSAFSHNSHNTGFPTATRTRPSQWKSRLQKKGLSSMSDSFKSSVNSKRSPIMSRSSATTTTQESSIPSLSLSVSSNNEVQSEGSTAAELAEIAKQNEETVKNMSLAEIEETKNELLSTFDPSVLKMLMARSQRKAQESSTEKTTESKLSTKIDTPEPKASMSSKSADQLVQDIVPVIEGAGTWIGGGRNGEKDVIYSSSSAIVESENEDADDKQIPLSRSSSMSSSNSGLKPALRKNSVSSMSSGSSEKKVRFKMEASVNYVDDKKFKKKNSKSKSSNDDEWEDVEELAPPVVDDPIADNAKVHFPKPKKDSAELLDLNDPNFNEKLHEKYFPDLPVNTEQLEWMKPLDAPPKEIIYEAIEELRFDFNGDIITSENAKSINTYEGLHHHSANAEIPGYTLAELAHFSRSTYPGQRCIGIRTLGRILHKLSTFHYSVFELDEYEEMGTDEKTANRKEQGQKGQFESKVWELVNELRIPETITEAADEKKTKNLSVRNYAIEALWLWKQTK